MPRPSRPAPNSASDIGSGTGSRRVEADLLRVDDDGVDQVPVVVKDTKSKFSPVMVKKFWPLPLRVEGRARAARRAGEGHGAVRRRVDVQDERREGGGNDRVDAQEVVAAAVGRHDARLPTGRTARFSLLVKLMTVFGWLFRQPETTGPT
jgi:hypothetical protein